MLKRAHSDYLWGFRQHAEEASLELGLFFLLCDYDRGDMCLLLFSSGREQEQEFSGTYTIWTLCTLKHMERNKNAFKFQAKGTEDQRRVHEKVSEIQ